MNKLETKAGKYSIRVNHDITGKSDTGFSVDAEAYQDGVKIASVFAESPDEYRSLAHSISTAVESATGCRINIDPITMIRIWAEFSIASAPKEYKWLGRFIDVPPFIMEVDWISADTHSMVRAWLDHEKECSHCGIIGMVLLFFLALDEPNKKALIDYAIAKHSRR